MSPEIVFVVIAIVNDIIYNKTMAPRKMRNFRIDEDLAVGLRRVRERDGISESEQTRRGIRLWLKLKGIKPTARTKRS